MRWLYSIVAKHEYTVNMWYDTWDIPYPILIATVHLQRQSNPQLWSICLIMLFWSYCSCRSNWHLCSLMRCGFNWPIQQHEIVLIHQTVSSVLAHTMVWYPVAIGWHLSQLWHAKEWYMAGRQRISSSTLHHLQAHRTHTIQCTIPSLCQQICSKL